MRIKFERGMTPEVMADIFVKLIRNNNVIIGTVNMYVQTLENEGVEAFHNNELLVCKPNDILVERYENDVSNIRRKRIKVVLS